MTRKNQLLKSTTLVMAALALTMGTPLSAMATSNNQVEVKFDRKYLQTDWGVELVYEKLQDRAQRECSNSATRLTAQNKQEKLCVSKLLDDFIRTAKSEKLMSYHMQMKDRMLG